VSRLTAAQQAEITRQLRERRSTLRKIVGLGAFGVVLLALAGPPFVVVVGAAVLFGVLVVALARHHRKVIAAVEAAGWRRE
jgi:hypothetical protein